MSKQHEYLSNLFDPLYSHTMLIVSQSWKGKIAKLTFKDIFQNIAILSIYSYNAIIVLGLFLPKDDASNI